MRVCFGIISIGKKYLEEFERLFKPSVLAYCNKYKYDLKIFTDYLDPIRTHPDTISFQKCLVPSFLMNYDIVVILDADIYINMFVEPIDTLELYGKIGIVNEVEQSTPEAYSLMVDHGFADIPTYYYKKADFDIETDKILNTGLMICRPDIHADYLKSIYEKYVNKSIGHPRGFHYEQSCIGYELQKDDMFTLIPNVWNFIYIHAEMTKSPIYCNFVHYAGLRGDTKQNALTRQTGKSSIRWGIKK